MLYGLAVFMSGRAAALEIGETEPLDPAVVYVVDGDTIRVAGSSYRLTGFDAPEIGRCAECEGEVAKGYDAKERVVDLVHGGELVALTRSACACPPDAPEGTMGCNCGRRCGTLRVAGEDVGTILMREGLAKPAVSLASRAAEAMMAWRETPSGGFVSSWSRSFSQSRPRPFGTMALSARRSWITLGLTSCQFCQCPRQGCLPIALLLIGA